MRNKRRVRFAKEPYRDEIREYLSYDPIAGDFRWIKAYSKSTMTTGKRAGRSYNGYRAITLFSEHYWEHRLAWWFQYGEEPKGEIDHVNGDPSDNRIANLRFATHAQNMRNVRTRANTKSGIKGVYERGDKYWSRIRCDGEYYHLGTFKTAEQATAAYQQAAKRLFGEYARIEQ